MPPFAPSVVVVGTGSDARMRSDVAKPLHTICGRSLVSHVLSAVAALEPRRLGVVIGADDDDVAKELDALPVAVSRVAADVRYDPCAAVLTALHTWAADELADDHDPDDDDVLIVPASVPLLGGETLRSFHRAHRAGDAAATVLVGPSQPADARADSSVWFVRRSLLAPALRRAEAPEIAALADVLTDTGHDVKTFVAPDDLGHREIVDRVDLAAAEDVLRARINARWMRRGVTMIDPSRTYVDIDVELAPDVTLHPGVMLRGTTAIGSGTEVGPGCVLIDSRIGARCRLEQTSASLATVGDHARVGPFAVLEPGCDVSAATVTGPFYTAGPDAR